MLSDTPSLYIISIENLSLRGVNLAAALAIVSIVALLNLGTKMILKALNEFMRRYTSCW